MRHWPFPQIWLAVAAGTVFIAGVQLYDIVRPENITAERAKYVKQLEGLEERFGDEKVVSKEQVKVILEELEGSNYKSNAIKSGIARIGIILKTESDDEYVPDFSGVNLSTDDITNKELEPEVRETRTKLNEAFKKLYTSKQLSAKEATSIKTEIGKATGNRWPNELAAKRADKLAGIRKKNNELAIGTMLLAFIAAGIVAIAVYVSKLKNGEWQPSDVPLRAEGEAAGDGLGLRFLLYLIAPSLIFSAVAPAFKLLPDGWASLAGGALTLMMIPIIVVPMLGNSFSLKRMGLSLAGFQTNALWGLGAWLTTLPVIFLVVPQFDPLFKWLPSTEHPLTFMLADPAMLLPAFISAAVIAPLVEEIFYRGCLYQGLALRLPRSPWIPIIISSFAFAAVHPQGGSAWLGLAWIGGTAAMVYRQTGSLIAPIVMHAANNGFLLFLSVMRG